jgi:hypothetical protein
LREEVSINQAEKPPEDQPEGMSASVLESELRVRDFILRLLYNNLGEKDSWTDEKGIAAFALDKKYGNLECISEGSLQYELPSGYPMSHKSDILIQDKTDDNHISIEIKHRSAVTDQFKCRTYDMLHLKQSHPKLHGIMIYVKSTSGISPSHAKSICYPFDYFTSVPEQEINDPKKWENLLSNIREKLEHKT